MLDATVDASGTTGGGTVRVGGPEAGEGELATAQNLGVNNGAELSADATQNGDGGNVVAWSDGTTIFDGQASATGGPDGGDGGFVEISGSNLDASLSSADVSAASGENGTVLLDPTAIEIAGGSGTSGGDNTIDFGEGSGTLTMYEDDLEGFSSDIVLEATDLIETSGSFGDEW